MPQIIGNAVAEVHRKQLSTGPVIAKVDQFALSGYQCVGVVERVENND
jgi:hypothetical protein